MNLLSIKNLLSIELPEYGSGAAGGFPGAGAGVNLHEKYKS